MEEYQKEGELMEIRRTRKGSHLKKNLYNEAKEIQDMTPEEVAAYRKQLQLDISGDDVPNPIKTWYHAGLPTILLETIRTKLKYAEAPLPLQAQALPVIMSGRDCVVVAKRYSGKLLAFGLPMVTHLTSDVRKVPIGLVVAPTVELVDKIHNSLLKFTGITHLVCVPLYGEREGSSVDIFKQNPLLKLDAGIVYGTPDTIMSTKEIKRVLARVTFLVFYRADAMVDMGFEAKLVTIAKNIRYDRQTLVFSSTYDHQGVSLLASKVTYKPVEIIVDPMSPPLVEEVIQGVLYHPDESRYEAQLEINDFPVKVLWKVIGNRETDAELASIRESTGTTITVKGEYIQPPLSPHPGQRKLYLSILGATEQSVMVAKGELDRFLRDITSQTSSSRSSSQHGRHFYAVSQLRSTNA